MTENLKVTLHHILLSMNDEEHLLLVNKENLRTFNRSRHPSCQISGNRSSSKQSTCSTSSKIIRVSTKSKKPLNTVPNKVPGYYNIKTGKLILRKGYFSTKQFRG